MFYVCLSIILHCPYTFRPDFGIGCFWTRFYYWLIFFGIFIVILFTWYRYLLFLVLIVAYIHVLFVNQILLFVVFGPGFGIYSMFYSIFVNLISLLMASSCSWSIRARVWASVGAVGDIKSTALNIDSSSVTSVSLVSNACCTLASTLACCSFSHSCSFSVFTCKPEINKYPALKNTQINRNKYHVFLHFDDCVSIINTNFYDKQKFNCMNMTSIYQYISCTSIWVSCQNLSKWVSPIA